MKIEEKELRKERDTCGLPRLAEAIDQLARMIAQFLSQMSLNMSIKQEGVLTM